MRSKLENNGVGRRGEVGVCGFANYSDAALWGASSASGEIMRLKASRAGWLAWLAWLAGVAITLWLLGLRPPCDDGG
ncbi:hypothetical protein EJ06DRAFT_17075 [Trichodelitschia bisporula]|uniref:Uncharacterized protein n=1 Tax=Trichodelitschia bisporula TaxID=703511 RepID=A0A6G1IA78_9PEZI|nr:hypothetical protein EJ06DRAFT_17075 [Trichodelitschia bisporula]